MSDSVRPHRRQPTRLPNPWDSPGKNTGVGCHFLLRCMKVSLPIQEVTDTGGLVAVMSNSCDPMNCSLSGSFVHGILQERILEWVAISFSRGSSQPRNRTRVSCIAERCFTDWAMRQVLTYLYTFIFLFFFLLWVHADTSSCSLVTHGSSLFFSLCL